MGILSAPQTRSREAGGFAARGGRSRELLRGYGIGDGKERKEDTGKEGAGGGKKVWEGSSLLQCQKRIDAYVNHMFIRAT